MEKSMQLHLAGIQHAHGPIEQIKSYYENNTAFQSFVWIALGAFVLFIFVYILKQTLIQKGYDINKEIFDMGLALLGIAIIFPIVGNIGASMFFDETGYYESNAFTVKTVENDGPRPNNNSLSDLKVTPENGEPFVITVSKSDKTDITKGHEYKLETKRMILSDNSSKRIDPDQMIVKIKDIKQ